MSDKQDMEDLIENEMRETAKFSTLDPTIYYLKKILVELRLINEKR